MMTSNTPCSIPRLARVAVLLAGMSLTSSLFAAERLAPMLDLQGVGQDPQREAQVGGTRPVVLNDPDRHREEYNRP